MRRLAPGPLLLFFFFFSSTLILWAGGNPESTSLGNQGGSDIDYLGVAAVMIRDGNYERASSALEKVDLGNSDKSRYYTLRGLVSIRVGDYPEAVANFEHAVREGQDGPVINVYLAQAYYATEQYENALGAIAAIQNLNQYPALYGIRAEALWRLGRHDEAFVVLTRAISLFPSQTQFARQRIFYLIELDLTQAAAEASVEYLEGMEDDSEAYVTIGEALRRGDMVDLSIRTLEMARIRYPGNERVLLALAQAYLSAEMPRIAGGMVEEAAATNNALYHDAAEIYRRAGAYSKALYLNSQIVDQERKALQRFNLLIGMERYEEAVALEPRLVRSGASTEDATRYALAFALFQTRRLDRAAAYVNQISSVEYFRRATQLRRAIETIRAQDFQYYQVKGGYVF